VIPGWETLKQKWPQTTARAEKCAAGEVAPPGWEDTVKGMKKHPEIDNPFALSWFMHNQGHEATEALGLLDKVAAANGNGDATEAVSASSFGALLRPEAKPAPTDADEPDETKPAPTPTPATRKLTAATEARSLREGFRPFREARVDEANRRIYTVLLTEGLGNLRDRNYYGPEAIDSGVQVLEGAQSFINHLSESEERDRPEGDVLKLCGVWTGLEKVRVEPPDGSERVAAIAGWLNFDSSATGREAFAKAKDAIRFREDLGVQRDYLGVSINADGTSHPAKVHGEDVNYVDEITHASSCDIVTRAGRGGRFLHLGESLRTARQFGDRRDVAMAKKNVLLEAFEALKKRFGLLQEIKAKLDPAKLKELDLAGHQELTKQVGKLCDNGTLDDETALSVLQTSLGKLAAKGGGDAADEPAGDGMLPEAGMEGAMETEEDDAGCELKPKEAKPPQESARPARGAADTRFNRVLQEKVNLLKENATLKEQIWVGKMRDLATEKLTEAALPKGLLSVKRLTDVCKFGATLEENKASMDDLIEEKKAMVAMVLGRQEPGQYQPIVESGAPRQTPAAGGDPALSVLVECGVPLKEPKKAAA
jgi:hypothetical protein